MTKTATTATTTNPEKEAYIITTNRTINNQFNNRIYNISIIQNISYAVASIKMISIFLQTHVTFCEYLGGGGGWGGGADAPKGSL